MVYRLILAEWARLEAPHKRTVLEGEFTEERLDELNAEGYNIFYLPNYPSVFEKGGIIDGAHIDTFRFVFVDFDLKSNSYPTKEAFLAAIAEAKITPTILVDSGGGIHAYWQVTDLDAMSYLRLSRRLMRKFRTDEAVGKIYQLMRVPGSVNVKYKDNLRLCGLVQETNQIYSCEELDKLLPPLTVEDETYCQQHYAKTYNKTPKSLDTVGNIPKRFYDLIDKSKEAKEIWSGNVEDRSAGDYRLGHLMFADGFTKDDARSVLVNSAKASSRAPIHRISYADNIIDKIWTEEATAVNELSESVASLLSQGDDETLKGDRIFGSKYFDATDYGLRLGHVFGLVAGVGVGKTTVSLNLFKSFIELNPQWHHMFISLEQPSQEIAARLKKMFAGNTASYDKIHIMSNENKDGSKRDLSLHEIQDYILDFQKRKNVKIACVVLDHIGILKMVTKNGENQGLMDTCRELKGFARSTNTLFIVQSQSSREKAGDGDIELFKSSAYGTQHFESYMDFLMVIWSPLKRKYDDPACPLVTAYKFPKIRFKSPGRDKVIEDQCYRLIYDPETELLRGLTQTEERSFDFFNGQCINIRKRDKKTDLIPYKSVDWHTEGS